MRFKKARGVYILTVLVAPPDAVEPSKDGAAATRRSTQGPPKGGASGSAGGPLERTGSPPYRPEKAGKASKK